MLAGGLKNRWIFLVGVLFGTLFPPGATSFLLGLVSILFSGGFAIYDLSAVTESLGLFFLVYLIPEIILALILFRNKANRLGWVLTAYFVVNLILGVVAFQSMLLCGFC